MRDGLRGFTLVEMLVVISIILVLAAMAVPMIGVARRSAAKKDAKFRINNLSVALGNYQSDWGDYPPTDWEREYNLKGNGLNVGIESLVAHLARRQKNGPYLQDIKEVDYRNTDTDQSPELQKRLNWLFGDAQLRELVDPWENAYVYIHNRDYGKPFDITDGNKEAKKVSVAAVRSQSLNAYQGFSTFQIWSLGPNGKSENGGGDDICSWQ